MNINRNLLRRPTALVSAVALLVSVMAPTLVVSFASAATQVSNRSIQLSNSTVAATGVSYKVTFTPQTATGLSLVLDFCQDSPIIGGSCNTTNGVTFSSPTVTASTLPTGWAYDTSSGSTIKLKGTTTTLASGTAYTFTINNVNNPTGTAGSAGTPGSFYARLYTFANNTYGTYASAASPGNYSDYGGFAMSTANNVTITATVMETLSFCVSKVAPGNGCAATTTPALTLGHGSPLALDSTAVDTDTAYTQLSTNANSGAIVALKTVSSTLCSGLSRDNGATCGIPANGTPATAISIGSTGGAKFGLLVGAGSGGTGTVSANSNYNAGAATYGMGATAPYGTYGDPIESSSTACANVNSLLTYAATAATTTPAGVYSTTESLIATGTF